MEAAHQVWAYFQAYPLAASIIAYVAGWAASVTVERGRSRIWLFHLVVGVFGSFLGQYALVYLGLREILEKLPEFRYLFDFFIAYLGSFVVAAIVHFIKPL
jgi:uncharacterized membrane protein YeaQ/YmgE (transglycosylase-associated protein family)